MNRDERTTVLSCRLSPSNRSIINNNTLLNAVILVVLFAPHRFTHTNTGTTENELMDNVITRVYIPNRRPNNAVRVKKPKVYDRVWGIIIAYGRPPYSLYFKRTV